MIHKLQFTPPPISDERDREIIEERERFQSEQRAAARRELFRSVFAERPRYAPATLANFEVETEAQQRAADAIRQYCSEIRERVKVGSGLLLFGPSGTGKDHLLAAAAKAAIAADLALEWTSGPKLFAEARDRIKEENAESDFIGALVHKKVLAISDPLPPSGALTQYQQSTLFAIVDGRYGRHRPTWVTLNVANRQEAEERLGVAIVDRLVDGALVIHANWKSYRRAAGKVG